MHMDQFVRRKLTELKPHPKNDAFFHDLRLSPKYPLVREQVCSGEIQNPLTVLSDGTVVSGHLHYLAALELEVEEAPIQLYEGNWNEVHELEFLLQANAQLGYLGFEQIAIAYSLLLGGAIEKPKDASKGGRPKKGAAPSPERRQSTKERVARLLGVSAKTAEHLHLIYLTPGVPADIHDAVENRMVPIALAADAVQFSIHEALRRNPHTKFVVVDPIDVRTYIETPPNKRRTKMVDLLKGKRPRPLPPVMLEGKEVADYHKRVFSSVPPPFHPKQSVQSMIRDGVHWDDLEVPDNDIPLHEAIGRIRARLSKAFEAPVLVHEDKVEEALNSLLLEVARLMKSHHGKEVSVRIGSAPVAPKPRPKATVKPKAESKPPSKPPAPTVFATEVEFIVSLLGLETVQALGR